MKTLPVVLLCLTFFLMIQTSKTQLEFKCCEGDIRLLDGGVLNEGIVEVCLSGRWKTVCDNSWSDSEAKVVCKQLGYSHQDAAPLIQANQGLTTKPTAIIECKGTEMRLVDCIIQNLSPDNQCSHSGIRCSCRNGDVRLEGGSIQGSGRVEVCVDNEWGSVCNDSWTELNARVVCKQLGFPVFGARPANGAAYGRGSGPVHIHGVRCTGDESSLINCSHSTQHMCSNTSDAGVQCQARPPCYDGEVRLVDGRYPHEGRVEVCLNETWGKICDYISIYGWDRTEAEVVCRQLGYTGANTSSHGFGMGTVPVTLLNPRCQGTESSLAECVYTISQNVCSRSQHDIVGIQCIQDTIKNGELRLTDGLTRFEGRVEMYWNSEWRTICNDGWDESDAKVVCRQLNYLSTSLEIKATVYRKGYKGTSMLLANVGCTGSESNLTSCCATEITSNNNSSQCHGRDHAGVRCAQCVENSIQLVGELSGNEGFVAICLGGSWGKVCGGNAQVAQVVCKQLGFSAKEPYIYNYQCFFDVISALPFLITNVQCTSNETQLSQCSYEYRGIASCGNLVGIKCQLTAQNIPGAPVNVQVTNVTPSTIGLSWSPPLVSETLGLAIYSYTITCSRGLQLDDATHMKTTDGHSAIFLQLLPFTQYNCCVRVNSENGPGVPACLSATTATVSSGGVNYRTSSTVLAIFFVTVSIALIAALTVLIYFHHKQCITAIKKIINYNFRQEKQFEKAAHDAKHPAHKPESMEQDVENLEYEFVDTPLENNPKEEAHSASDYLPYQVTVLSEMKNTCSEAPVEYLTPSNTELITCDLCIEHGTPMGVCTHKRSGAIASNSYQSLILTESTCPTPYQELVQESPKKFKRSIQ